jgi:hypothetical protein
MSCIGYETSSGVMIMWMMNLKGCGRKRPCGRVICFTDLYTRLRRGSKRTTRNLSGWPYSPSECDKGNVKVKLSLCFNWAPRHEGVLGEWRYTPLILRPRYYMEVSGQLHAPAALPPGKNSLVPIGQEAGWAPEPFWTRWWREKFPAPAGNRTLEPRSSSP